MVEERDEKNKCFRCSMCGINYKGFRSGVSRRSAKAMVKRAPNLNVRVHIVSDNSIARVLGGIKRNAWTEHIATCEGQKEADAK